MVLDILRLINNLIGKFFTLVIGNIPPEKVIRSDTHVIICVLLYSLLALLLVACNQLHLQFRPKPSKLLPPVKHKGSRCNDQRCHAFLFPGKQEGYRLYGFSKSHIIGKNTPELAGFQCLQPLKAIFLVTAHHALKTVRHLIIRVTDGLEILDHFSECMVPVCVKAFLFLKQLVQVKCPVYRKVDFAFDKFLRRQVHSVHHFLQHLKVLVLKVDKVAILQPVIFFVKLIALQNIQQLFTADILRLNLHVKQTA